MKMKMKMKKKNRRKRMSVASESKAGQSWSKSCLFLLFFVLFFGEVKMVAISKAVRHFVIQLACSFRIIQKMLLVDKRFKEIQRKIRWLKE